MVASELLDTKTSNPVEFMTKEFLAMYLVMLAGCTGKGQLRPRSTDERQPPYVSGTRSIGIRACRQHEGPLDEFKV